MVLLLLFSFTKSNLKPKLYEPTYRMGTVGFEPSINISNTATISSNP